MVFTHFKLIKLDDSIATIVKTGEDVWYLRKYLSLSDNNSKYTGNTTITDCYSRLKVDLTDDPEFKSNKNIKPVFYQLPRPQWPPGNQQVPNSNIRKI